MDDESITCLVADDHPLMREIIRIRLEAAGIELAEEAADGETAVERIARTRPDVAIIDLRMPSLGGIELVTRVAALGVDTRTLLYSDDANPSVVRRAIAAGACGYLNKASSKDLLACAVRMIAGGGRFIDPLVAATLLDAPALTLSPRELDVLSLMADGKQNKVIALALDLSEETVKSHVSSLMAKLGVTSRTGAVGVALRKEIVS